MPDRKLTRLTAQQVALARNRWSEGKTLGEIAAEIGCSIFALIPWLDTEATSE
jgi:hypothetical protein